MLRNATQNNLFYYTTLLLIIVVSYMFYASSNYPVLNSDDSLNVLMAHYYDFPQDAYCWGQDRGGTIIPFFAQIFIKGFGASAIDAVSLTNYAILILGFIGFSSLLKERSTRILFALVWFLPYQRFIDITRFPIGVQYSLLAFAVFLILRVRFEERSAYWKSHIYMAMITLVLGLAIWASDLAIVSTAVLLFALLVRHYIQKRTLWFRKEIWLYLIGGSALWTYLILKAKSYATNEIPQYTSFNTFDQIGQAFKTVGREFGYLLLEERNDHLTQLYAWLVPILVIIVLVLVFRKKIAVPKTQQTWLRWAVLDFGGILGVIFLSHWVLINQMGRWYFVGTYIMAAMILLILIENNLLSGAKRKALMIFTWLLVLLGSASTFYNMRFVSSKTFRSSADITSELTQLGPHGIIADFWNAYRSSCAHPDIIKATPHDQSNVRNQQIVDEVFAQPKLYVIRDMWMTSFPDTLHQFGFTIVKAGKPFFLGGSNICRYKRLKQRETFRVPRLKADPAFIRVEQGDSSVRVTADMVNAQKKHIVYGPFVSLLPGTYTVRYHIKASNFRTDKDFALIDIAAEYGSIPLLAQGLKASDFSGDKESYRYIDIELKVDRRLRNVEFRLLYDQGADVSLDKIELIER